MKTLLVLAPHPELAETFNDQMDDLRDSVIAQQNAEPLPPDKGLAQLAGIGDEAIVGVDLHVASAGKLGVIAQPFHVLATCGICLVGTHLKFALNFQCDGQRHRRHHLN